MRVVDIRILEEGWPQDVAIPDVKAVLVDASRHLLSPLRRPIEEMVLVSNTPASNPITQFRKTHGQGPISIRLSIEGRYWAQLAYQAAHEFCHVIQQYEALRNSSNRWFHEAICEAASLFVLRQMSTSWESDPPYPGWAGYASSLLDYANSRLDRPEHHLQAGGTVAEFLAEQEASLREDQYQREKNGLVASLMLPLFEGTPGGWNAVTRLPPSSAPFHSYLSDWEQRVEQLDQSFVNQIQRLFTS